ncbi:hypothetical protein JCM6882_004578 [Rhodosporidiobolus microsporus]
MPCLFEDELTTGAARVRSRYRRTAWGGLLAALVAALGGSFLSRRTLASSELVRQVQGRTPSHEADNSWTHAFELFLSSTFTNFSAPWTPLRISHCGYGVPPHYAPCVSKRLEGVEYAQELLYPDFEIREPFFVTKEQKQRWRRMVQGVKQRGSLQDDGWVSYRGQHGENYVFTNASCHGEFDTWAPDTCMSDLTSTNTVRHVESLEAYSSHPDFRHHLDRSTHIVAQAAHLTFPPSSTSSTSSSVSSASASSPHVLTGRSPSSNSSLVPALWGRLGFPPPQVLHTPDSEKVVARRLVWSCRTPLVHPWLSLRMVEMYGLLNKGKISETRKKVVYMSRSNPRASRPGRRALNEPAVLSAIQSLLLDRKRGEELVIFDETAFPTLEALFDFFQKEVVAVVGPHGGAIMNHRWAPRDTLVLEFLPTAYSSVANWEDASLLSQQYAAIVVPPAPLDRLALPGRRTGTDMVVEPGEVVALLGEFLEKRDEERLEDPLRRFYPWRAAELQVNV